MRDRALADVLVGAIACFSVLGFYAVLRESEYHGELRRRRAALRWALPRKRRGNRSPEDDCRECGGSGNGVGWACHGCCGTGLQPRDASTVSRLTMLWDGVA